MASLSSRRKPRWSLLYAVFLPLIALFALDARAHLSGTGHEIVEIGIVLLVYGLVFLWLQANKEELDDNSRDDGG